MKAIYTLYYGSNMLDNYNSSAYYEPLYVIVRAYNDGGF